jgi:phospholipase/carboxylesterase
MLVGPDKLGEARARNARDEPPPILLVHGEQDPLIPLEAMLAAADDLARAEIPNQWHLSFGLGHGIDAGGLRHGGLFLAQAFRAAGR